MTWIDTLFLGFIFALIFTGLKKRSICLESGQGSVELVYQGRRCLTVASMLIFFVKGILLIPTIVVCHRMFYIMGALSSSRGDAFDSRRS
jgi:hypothetical protein